LVVFCSVIIDVFTLIAHTLCYIYLLGATIAVGAEETPETLWGEGKQDPKDALEAEGFQMRRVVLTPKVRNAKPVVTESA
jgi:hypothetical protein